MQGTRSLLAGSADIGQMSRRSDVVNPAELCNGITDRVKLRLDGLGPGDHRGDTIQDFFEASILDYFAVLRGSHPLFHRRS